MRNALAILLLSVVRAAWHLGATGSSCTSVCSALSQTCVPADLVAAHNTEATGGPGSDLFSIIQTFSGYSYSFSSCGSKIESFFSLEAYLRIGSIVELGTDASPREL